MTVCKFFVYKYNRNQNNPSSPHHFYKINSKSQQTKPIKLNYNLIIDEWFCRVFVKTVFYYFTLFTCSDSLFSTITFQMMSLSLVISTSFVFFTTSFGKWFCFIILSLFYFYTFSHLLCFAETPIFHSTLAPMSFR